MGIEAFMFVGIGIFAMIKGAEYLVDGSSSLAHRLRVPASVIGLTVVAFGTSLPEFMVSLVGALRNTPSIATGTVIGSNIVNILFIPAVLAFIRPLVLRKNTIWTEIPMSFLAAIVLAFLSLRYIIEARTPLWTAMAGNQQVGVLSASDGLTLLSFFAVFAYYALGIARANRDVHIDLPQFPLWRSLTYVTGGLIALSIGSELTVTNAIKLADALHISRSLVGLTVLALGTGMPELITGIIAMKKGQPALAIGNLVGSNIFNIFFILGTVSVIRPITLTGWNVAEILFLLCATSFTFLSLFVFKRHSLGHREATGMLLMYGLFLIYLFSRGL